MRIQQFGLQQLYYYGRKIYDQYPERVHCTLLGIAGMLILVVTIQMFFPYDRLLPGVSIADRKVGMQRTAATAKSIEARYDNARIIVKAGSHETLARAKYIGVEVVPEPTAELAAMYPMRQRLIPFSFFSKAKTNIQPILRFDDIRLKEFAEEVAKKSNSQPENASVAITDNKIILKPAVAGKSFAINDTIRQLHAIDLRQNTVLNLIPKVEQPKRSDESVRPALTAAQRVVDAELKLQVSGETITVDKKTLASWIDFKEAASGTSLEVTTNQEAVKNYLRDLQTRINQTPGTTAVVLVDGQTVNRTEGVAGFGVDVDKSAAMIAERLFSTESTLTLPLISLPAKVVYNRSYTDTQKGLAALVTDVAAQKGNASLVVLERGGQNRDARVGGGKVWPAASMYKIYVAYAIFKEIDAGNLTWDTPISFGKNTASCFESMIVLSDNVCAVAFLDKLGRGHIQDQTRALGLSGTSFINGNYTTANDLALFLTKLEDGTLISSGYRTKLLDVMKRQIYRSGIPLGSGAVTANKVGYIWGIRHDAGIVYSPQGTYIEVIMTNGLEWSSIADAARQIGLFMDR